MKNFKLSLRTEIILNMTILMLAMIILVSILMILTSRRDIYLKKAEGSLELIRSLSNIVAPVVNFSADIKSDALKKNEMAILVERFFIDQKNVRITVALADGKIFYDSDKNIKNDRVIDEKFYELIQLGSPFTQFQESNSKLLNESPRGLNVYFPITKEGAISGGVIAQFSLSRERTSAARSQTLILVSIILDAILFIIFGSFLLSRVIVKPIKKLVCATEKIAGGNLDFKVEPFPTKEIDSLSQSFNEMTKKLLMGKESLQKHLESLEKVNRELKQAKDEALRSEKLASVGRLAAGIAHEIGNPLGSILGYLDILTEDDDANLDEYIKRIQKECYRIDLIVRELLDYSREHKFTIEKVNLTDIVNETCDTLFHRKMFAEIACNKELSCNLPYVMVDKRQIQQVITNLIINAADAMEERGGTITLKTDTVKYNKDLFSSQTLRDGDSLVRFSIFDTGCGIDEKSLDKIFDPFYTTKEPGKGTGLGLAISLRIVESFNGTITAQSDRGNGTVFNIFIPVNIIPVKN